jgi:hypothetical protein
VALSTIVTASDGKRNKMSYEANVELYSLRECNYHLTIYFIIQALREGAVEAINDHIKK